MLMLMLMLTHLRSTLEVLRHPGSADANADDAAADALTLQVLS